jgi:ribose transport system permease protein
LFGEPFVGRNRSKRWLWHYRLFVCGCLGGVCKWLRRCFWRIQPIIATLATGAVYMGLALFLRPIPGGKINEDINWAMTNALGDFAETVGIFDDGKAAWFQPVAGVPTALVLLIIVALVTWVPFRRSVTGRTVYAIGSAEGAAFMSGLNIAGGKLAAFTLAGLFAGIGGIFMAIQTSSGNADIPMAGAYTLSSIASVVIGGTSLFGGRGSLFGSVLGALIVGVFSTGLALAGVDSYWQYLTIGVLIIMAVAVDQWLRRASQ